MLDDITVLDLTWGVAGPLTGMLLADQGARVTRVLPPGGDPYESSGSRVWRRGKEEVTLDLKSPEERDRFLGMCDGADVVIESWSPGVAERLGVDHATLLARNPRLVACSIDGYGDTKDRDRPGIDALVAARTGQLFESRGTPGTTLGRISGVPVLPELDVREDLLVGARRPGPLFPGLPWASLAAFYLATLGIEAALRAREITGKGQHVHTSLLQGVLATTIGSWQRVEKAGTPSFLTWVADNRAPKGFFQGSDGEWMHHWVVLPPFVLGAAEGHDIAKAADLGSPRKSGMRISTDAEEMIVLHSLYDELRAAIARFPTAEWEQLAAEVGVPVQRVRSPEEALLDDQLVADGCVVEVDGVRQVGSTIRITPNRSGHGSVRQVDESVTRTLQHPLEGVRVLDLGLAVAGPFGGQLLGDLGADVIKVNNALFDSFWMKNHIAMCCNRNKRSITIDLKQLDGMKLFHELLQTADVVHHNMRYDAAERLGVDYESLRKVKPDLVYCHTRGHDRGPREQLPGNDQTGACLAGVSWMEGGVESGAMPIWPITSLGDTGNGFLSAIGVVQALRHRDRTGEGSFVDTSILYAHLLNASLCWIAADGSDRSARPKLDLMQTQWSDHYGLRECSDGRWLCVAALTPGQQATHDRLVDAPWNTRTADEWFALLDGAGVPCEIANPKYVDTVFDDPELIARGWVTAQQNGRVGRMETLGLLVDFSDTPGVIRYGPLVPGERTREIMAELGYDDEQVDKYVASGVLGLAD